MVGLILELCRLQCAIETSDLIFFHGAASFPPDLKLSRFLDNILGFTLHNCSTFLQTNMNIEQEYLHTK